jgi:glucokinase
MQILAGDIGGTNTRLALADVNGAQWRILAEKTYASDEFSGLVQVIRGFLAEHGINTPLDAACLAVAGPVKSGVAAITNLPWVISEQQLRDELQTHRVKLINDFVAVAYGVSELSDTDILVLQQGTSDAGEQQYPDAAIIGAGTGLGISHRVWLNDHYQVYPSEAGHTGFAPENGLQRELLAWLQTQHSHVSLELLLSGRGLVTIYHFLRQAVGLAESSAINEAMRETDPASVITGHALSGADELCRKTLECFIDIYGAAAGNAALYYYPVGELYIAGGIAPKIRAGMMSRRFIDAFVNKGLMSSNMEKIQIKLVTQERVGLYGAVSSLRSMPD